MSVVELLTALECFALYFMQFLLRFVQYTRLELSRIDSTYRTSIRERLSVKF